MENRDNLVCHLASGNILSSTIDGFNVVTLGEQLYDDVLEGYENLKKDYTDMKEERDKLRRVLATNKRGKYKKDQYVHSIEKGLKQLLTTRLFPNMKFLPRGWDTWSEEKNSVCEILSSAIKNFPPTIHLPNYWRDVVVPYANQSYVNMRVNLNQRLKTQYAREYCFTFVHIILT